jgi:putative ABC transport system substrate-binding protein
MTDRRNPLQFLLVVAACTLLLPLDALAQTAARVHRIALLYTSTQPTPPSPNELAFLDELRQRGYVEGQNLVVERRDARGQPDRLPSVAKELIALKPDLIVTSGPQPSSAVKDATLTIPIVIWGIADPVGAGLVTNLARPGGNLTGVTSVAAGGIMAKSLDLLHQVAPKAARIGMLVNPTNVMHRVLVPQEIPAAARQLGVQIITVEASTADQIEPAIKAAVSQGAEALFIQGDPVFNNLPERIPQIVARTGLPAIYFLRTQAQAGGLMSFGPDFVELSRRAASYVDRILKGAKPGDLAIEQPTKIDLVINLKTAKTLGLTIPQSLRVQAELIE